MDDGKILRGWHWQANFPRNRCWYCQYIMILAARVDSISAEVGSISVCRESRHHKTPYIHCRLYTLYITYIIHNMSCLSPLPQAVSPAGPLTRRGEGSCWWHGVSPRRCWPVYRRSRYTGVHRCTGCVSSQCLSYWQTLQVSSPGKFFV